jgi:hypothetical protein
MKLLSVPFALLRFNYQVARVPLHLIENQLSARLTADAPVRLFYERSLGTLDVTVGNLLGDAELTTRGAALAERADARGRAAELDAQAADKREQADADFAATRRAAVADIREARDATEQQTVEARAAADERARAAEVTAQKRTAAASEQADQLAAQRVAAAGAVRHQGQATIRNGEQKVAKATEKSLGDARARREEAASKRVDADRVGELADAEKQRRRSARSNG